MMRLLAILNVVAWSAFWTFGAIALFAHLTAGEQMVAALLSGVGFIAGMVCHLQLCNRVAPTQRVAKQSEA